MLDLPFARICSQLTRVRKPKDKVDNKTLDVFASMRPIDDSFQSRSVLRRGVESLPKPVGEPGGTDQREQDN